LLELACKGPALHVALVREGSDLTFKVTNAAQPLAKRRMSRIPISAGTSPVIGAFEKRNAFVNVDN